MTCEIKHTLGLNDTPTGLKESDEDVCRGYSGVAAQVPFPPEPWPEEEPAFSARSDEDRWWGLRRPFGQLGDK